MNRQIRKELDDHARRAMAYADKPGARNLRPRDAAALIILDTNGKQPRVLMGCRHADHVFLPGVFVFPGGRVEPQDYQTPTIGADLDRGVMTKLMAGMGKRPSPFRATALAKAAFREAYEEAGIAFAEAGPNHVLAEAQAGFPPTPLHLLAYIARAVTPPFQKRRFDTRFFAIEAKHIILQHQGDGELLELGWLGFDEARNRNLPTITRAVLADVEYRLESGALLNHHCRVPTYCKRGVHFQRSFV